MNKKADIVIIGGGITGCAIFHELAKSKLGKVVLVESGELASATTGESGGFTRKFNIDPQVGKLSTYSFDYYQRFAQEVQDGDCAFERTGLTSRVSLSALCKLKDQIEALKSAGYQITVSNSTPTRSLQNTTADGVASAFIYEADLGHIDTKLTCRSWAQAAVKNGGTLIEHTKVEEILTANGRITGVKTSEGIIETNTVIVASGAWSKGLLDRIPVDSTSITARSFQYNLYINAAQYLDTAFMDNISGFYMGPMRNGNVFAGILNQNKLVEKDEYDHQRNGKEALTLHRLLESRFPWVGGSTLLQVKRSYDAFTEDERGTVSTFNQLPGLVLAAGWSAGGIRLAPAIAMQVQETLLQSKPLIGGIYANLQS